VTSFSTFTLITGPEIFLAEREVSRQIAATQAQYPEARLVKASAASLTPAELEQMSGTDLFSSSTIACITGAEKAPRELDNHLISIAGNLPDNLALIISHAGGREGKALLDKLTPLASRVLKHPVLKPRDLPEFVRTEGRDLGRTIAPAAARGLVDAIGQDTRSLAAAIAQLLADSEEEPISAVSVSQYFAGMATMTQYAVSDDILAGRVSDAIVKMRWALSTGVAHPKITAALASSLRQVGTYLSLSAKKNKVQADEIGIPEWKMKSFIPVARAWSPSTVASAIKAVSVADAQVKGASANADYALERLIIRLAHLRRSSNSDQ
jgi:DNA polymerase-3 subunit delta